jgi:mycothiol synthase
MNSSLPLRDRFDIVPTLPIPIHEDVARWRPATVADIDALWTLQGLAAAIEHPDLPFPRSYVAERFDHSSFHPETDSLIAVAADGTLLGVAYVDQGEIAESRVQLWLSGTVHPQYRRRGIGSQLARWELARAEQLLAASERRMPGWISFGADTEQPDQGELAERLGFHIARYFLEMRHPLAGVIPVQPAPEGTRIVPFTPELSAQTLTAFNDSFRDHWGHQPEGKESWDLQVSANEFDPVISRVALTDEQPPRVAGFVLGSRTDDGANAYIALIGVIRDYRRRGIAAALLTASLSAHRDAGVRRTTLDVDSMSPTAANTLYSSMGFVEGSASIAYLREY